MVIEMEMFLHVTLLSGEELQLRIDFNGELNESAIQQLPADPASGRRAIDFTVDRTEWRFARGMPQTVENRQALLVFGTEVRPLRASADTAAIAS